MQEANHLETHCDPDDYTDIAMEHFMTPRNVGRLGDPDGEGSFGDPDCGDYLTIDIAVRNNRIEDIKFLVFGCVASVATSSVTTELVKGKTIDEALKLTEQDIVDALGGLPENKQHCSNLGVQALKNAIKDYQSKQIGKK
jgi:nitrogen fixation NifU-like protein